MSGYLRERCKISKEKDFTVNICRTLKQETFLSNTVYLSEKLFDEQFRPANVKIPNLRRVADVGTVHDHRKRFRLVDAANAKWFKSFEYAWYNSTIRNVL